MTEPTDEDSIGYGHPPKEHQFKPGRSGNPRGRPRKEIDCDAVLGRELLRTVSVTEDGNRTRITFLEAVVRVYIRHALKGNFRFAKDILGWARSLSAKREMEDNDNSRNPFINCIEKYEHDEEDEENFKTAD